MLSIPPRKPVVEALVGIEMFFQRDHVYFYDFSGRFFFGSKEVFPVTEKDGSRLDEIDDGPASTGFDVRTVHAQ